MTEIEKAIFAIRLVKSLLSKEEKILAVCLIQHFYSTTLKEAKHFVDRLQEAKK